MNLKRAQNNRGRSFLSLTILVFQARSGKQLPSSFLFTNIASHPSQINTGHHSPDNCMMDSSQEPASSTQPEATSSSSATTSSSSGTQSAAAAASFQRVNHRPPSNPTSFTAHSHIYNIAESITDIRLFDGANSPQNIAVYGFGLGALFGASVILATVVQTSIPQFWLFLAALGVFHSMEYIAIALFNPTKLKLDCKWGHYILHNTAFRSDQDPSNSILTLDRRSFSIPLRLFQPSC